MVARQTSNLKAVGSSQYMPPSSERSVMLTCDRSHVELLIRDLDVQVKFLLHLLLPFCLPKGDGPDLA